MYYYLEHNKTLKHTQSEFFLGKVPAKDIDFRVQTFVNLTLGTISCPFGPFINYVTPIRIIFDPSLIPLCPILYDLVYQHSKTFKQSEV